MPVLEAWESQAGTLLKRKEDVMVGECKLRSAPLHCRTEQKILCSPKGGGFQEYTRRTPQKPFSQTVDNRAHVGAETTRRKWRLKRKKNTQQAPLILSSPCWVYRCALAEICSLAGCRFSETAESGAGIVNDSRRCIPMPRLARTQKKNEKKTNQKNDDTLRIPNGPVSALLPELVPRRC